MPNIERAKRIQGWMREPDLLWLAQRAEQCDVIVEVGCWKGRSTRALAENIRPGGKVYAVDHWLGSPNERTTSHAEAAPRGPFKQLFGVEKPVKRMFMDAMDGLIPDSCLPFEMDSQQAAELLAKFVSPDMVFIDATHTRDAVLADLRCWEPIVRPGGLLAGHDINMDSVRQAIADFGIEVQRAGVNIWYWRKPECESSSA